jgi:hypothetical protein
MVKRGPGVTLAAGFIGGQGSCTAARSDTDTARPAPGLPGPGGSSPPPPAARLVTAQSRSRRLRKGAAPRWVHVPYALTKPSSPAAAEAAGG